MPLRDVPDRPADPHRACVTAGTACTIVLALLLLVVALTLPATGQQAEKRVALVIGNSAYPELPLRNPVNDARAMAATLTDLGFEVIARENLTQKQMQRAILEFGQRLTGGGVALFYYAGHGMQVGGRNYLIPVDATIEVETHVRLEAVDVDAVLDQVRDNRLNLVILDACRTNPFERRFRGDGRGLAVVEAPVGTMIAYATAPGKVARDGDGANGLYTAELLQAIRTPGLTVENVFKRVRTAVTRQTRSEQVPWEASSLTGDFYFVPPSTPAQGHAASLSPPAPASRPAVTVVPRQEFGALAVGSPVTGVQVWLGDQKLGETRAASSLLVSNVLVGTYQLRAAKDGYRTWERQVQVTANRRTEVEIDIEPLRRDSAKTTLTVYTAVEADDLKKYAARFNEDVPDIEIRWVRDSTGIVTAKLLAEKANPQADVVWGLAATSMLVLKPEGILLSYAPKGLERLDPKFRDTDNPPAWVGMDAWIAAICLNTVEARKRNLPRPTSWKDLGKSVYKDTVVMPNPASSGTGFLDVSSWLQLFGEPEGWKFMDALHQNIAVYTHSGSRPCTMAAAGEYPIGISFEFRAARLKKQGAPIDIIFPSEGSGWDMEATAIVKGTKNLEAARRLVDWTITDKAMKLYTEGYAVVAVPKMSRAIESLPENLLQHMARNDFQWAATNRARILAQWDKRYGAKSEPKR